MLGVVREEVEMVSYLNRFILLDLFISPARRNLFKTKHVKRRLGVLFRLRTVDLTSPRETWRSILLRSENRHGTPLQSTPLVLLPRLRQRCSVV